MKKQNFFRVVGTFIVSLFIVVCFQTELKSQDVSADTTVYIYANYVDVITLNVPKNYVNAMIYKYGFDWKQGITNRLFAIGQEALAEYEAHKKQYIFDGLDGVNTISQLNALRQKSLGYQKTIYKSDIDSLKAVGFIIQ